MDSMALVLHAGNANKNAFKRLIAADYSGFQVELTENFEMGVSNKTSEFPKTNPIGKADSVPFVPSQKKSQTKEVVKPKKVKKERNQEAVEPKVQEVVEEEEEAPKPNPKNPLDLLLPSKMILNEWKRLYSNTKANFRELAIKGFWDMYDPVGYSFWFRDYKYNDENTVSFVTLNKVSGFLQRMDLARKYAFGKMLVTGSDPPFKVKGLWLFHGLEIPKFVLDEVYDMELYDWTKFTAFHISEPENNILHNHVILPNNGSLISQAVLPVGNQSFDYGTIWEAREVHFDCLHKWLDIDLGITHLIISAECVLVINLLQDHINSSYNKAQILSQRDDRHGEKGSDRPGRPCA
ncbi:alanine aminotransferase [Musa troglodytarum]|uniref:Alanine aminotransferase n=1 Tax=Musa troglodytarum TaxID=320322 RepID=A0A9E7HJB2_9LILI|nr:alanine aminotransferase [Musa troglodytarum]